MKIEVLENALSGINEKTLDSVLSERHKRMEKGRMSASVSETKRKSFFSLKKAIAVAAGFAVFLCSMAIIIPLSTRNSVNVDDPNTAEQLNTPQHIEGFISPELDELYKTKPYSELLPNIIPTGLSFKSSFLTTKDELSNPDDRKFLAVIFGSEDSSLEIKISEYDGSGSIADPDKPETYKLDLYYGPIENEGAVGADLPNVFRIIRSSDLSRGIASDRLYTFKDGVCKAEIDILCDEHIVSYVYTGKEISGSLFYDCITSSLFFERADRAEQMKLSGNANTDAENVPQYIPEFGTPTLEEVYTITPYSELLPKRLLSNCSFSGSYMTEYDPVANPDGHKFLALIFKTGNESWDTMEIKVSEYDGTSVLADINDKRTYALSYLYGNDSPPAGNALAGFSDLFHAEDITTDIIKEMVYTLPDGLCKAEISLLCGDYIVSYAYTGAEITVESFYDMIVSSEWLEK